MITYCPECGKSYKTMCSCGYKDPELPKTKGGRMRPQRMPIKLGDYHSVMVNECSVPGCSRLGTMTRSCGYADSDDANWVCRRHF